jgi:hypothetical protein
MATDYAALVTNLLAFYEFDDKTMISVGAGGGQLAGYGCVARKVLAVDPDEDRFVMLEKDFLAVSERAEVVLFEFCLHEIPDHGGALAHASALAADIVIIDHAPGSPWAHVVDETEKVAASWKAVSAHGTRRTRDYDAVQRFASYQELFDKVRSQGAEAIRRIERWRGCADITIPMAYRTALL